MSYTKQLNDLRAAAIADIRAYVERCGETTVKLHGRIAGAVIRIDEPYLVIGSVSATIVDTAALCLIADMLNQMP